MAIPKFLTGLRANNKRIQDVADPTVATDAANKQYVDNVANGRDWKESVRAASTANVTIASALTNGSSMDGVTLATGDRVLLKNQSAGAENGIYVVVASGAASRAGDADTATKLNAGATTSVEEGTVNGDKRFVLTTNAPIVLGTTALVFTVDASGGSTYVAGSGLAESPAGTFNVGSGNGISVAADAISVDTAVVVRKYAANCVATTNPQTFTHSLGTDDVQVEVWETNDKVYPDVTKGSGTVIVDWGGAPTASQYRVVVQA